MEPKRLTKGHTKMICGVCSGLAEYLNVDVTLVRLGTAVLTAAVSYTHLTLPTIA